MSDQRSRGPVELSPEAVQAEKFLQSYLAVLRERDELRSTKLELGAHVARLERDNEDLRNQLKSAQSTIRQITRIASGSEVPR
jgi:hypothetical protein